MTQVVSLITTYLHNSSYFVRDSRDVISEKRLTIESGSAKKARGIYCQAHSAKVTTSTSKIYFVFFRIYRLHLPACVCPRQRERSTATAHYLLLRWMQAVMLSRQRISSTSPVSLTIDYKVNVVYTNYYYFRNVSSDAGVMSRMSRKTDTSNYDLRRTWRNQISASPAVLIINTKRNNQLGTWCCKHDAWCCIMKRGLEPRQPRALTPVRAFAGFSRNDCDVRRQGWAGVTVAVWHCWNK